MGVRRKLGIPADASAPRTVSPPFPSPPTTGRQLELPTHA